MELAGGSLHYAIEKEKAYITGFHGQAAELVIPAVLEGYPVAEIGKKAFLSKKGLRRITLPDSLEAVGDWAFAYCAKIGRASCRERVFRAV